MKKKVLPPQSARSLGIEIGEMPTGPKNCITDVAGVEVGHFTLNTEKHIKTGVTTILPNKDIFNKKLIAGSFVLNGAGEISGLTQINEWGLLETPIALTNTMAVGQVSQAINKWMSKKFQKIWDQRYVIIPVVGECDDSFLNDSINYQMSEENIFEAFKNCSTGEVEQGSVGGGTGMVCCDFKGGIGSSSRQLKIEDKTYNIGVLVMSNFGYMRDFRVAGIPVGRILEPTQGEYAKRVDNYGSIIAVVATDLPCSPIQIQRLCKRASLGIGRVGSFAAHGSGEIILGFSTANVVRHGARKPHYHINVITDEKMNLAYRAVIEATEESIVNSITFSDDMQGLDNHIVPGIDKARLKKIFKEFAGLETYLSQ